jgi:hypothetical protein
MNPIAATLAKMIPLFFISPSQPIRYEVCNRLRKQSENNHDDG